MHPELELIERPLRALDAVRHNLPFRQTPLIGRVQELADLAEELNREPLVTLTGAGGIGKTRLAARVAADVADRFPGGVWWVNLAPLSDAAAIGATLLSAMGANEDGVRPALEVAKDRLSDDGALVVFDNCEHLVIGVAGVVDELRQSCSNLVVLATSREPLGVAGEVTWRVPSLSVPAPDATIDGLGGYDAVALFLDRAHRARPDMRLSAGQMTAVVEICRRLDGIPLAIELAAARCRQLAPERIVRDLDQRFRLLTGGARTSLPRQQTLLASVDWSHDLLDDDERRVLRRLAVCAGAFRLELAEALGSALGDLDSWSVADLLGRLVDKSLVQLEDHTDRHGHTDAEYRLLETVRQYALDRARDAGEVATLRDAHTAWWIAELERVDARQPTWDLLDLLSRHRLDLRSALDWLEPDPDGRHWLLSLVALGWSWGGHTDDTLDYVDRWVLDGPIDGASDLAWAQAFCACTPAMFAGWRDLQRLGPRAMDVVIEAGDGRAGLPALVSIAGEPEVRARRTAAAFRLAIADDCDVLLASFGCIFISHQVAADPTAARPILDVIHAAIARGRCPAPSLLWFNDLPAAPACVPLYAIHVPDVEARDDELFVLDRCFHAVGVLSPAVFVHGRLDQFDVHLALLERYRHFFLAETWLDGCTATRTIVTGDDLDDAGLHALVHHAAQAPVYVRYGNARAAISVGGRDVAAQLIAELDEAGAGKIADAVVQAVLRLHDDRILDAGHLLASAIALESNHVWTELRPDLLELSAVVAGGCHDHRRALVLLGAGQAARQTTGVHYRHRDQQAWIATVQATAARQLGTDDANTLVQRGADMSIDDALAYASRGTGERNRPSSGWDALTPTERRVVDLVATGLTNPQIAERLLMSRATVKTHVSHCLTKLDMTNRGRTRRRNHPPNNMTATSACQIVDPPCEHTSTPRPATPSRPTCPRQRVLPNVSRYRSAGHPDLRPQDAARGRGGSRHRVR